MILLANALGSSLFGVGLALLTVLLLMRSWRYQRRTRTARRRHTTAVSERSLGLSDAPRDILRWQVAMHETARDLKAELDSKMSALQAIIGIAQRESSRLEAAVRRAESLGIVAGRDTREAVEKLGESEHVTLPHVAPTEVAELIGPSDQRTRIYKQADAGRSPTEIANQEGLAVGEVEFLLSVRHPPP